MYCKLFIIQTMTLTVLSKRFSRKAGFTTCQYELCTARLLWTCSTELTWRKWRVCDSNRMPHTSWDPFHRWGTTCERTNSLAWAWDKLEGIIPLTGANSDRFWAVELIKLVRLAIMITCINSVSLCCLKQSSRVGPCAKKIKLIHNDEKVELI